MKKLILLLLLVMAAVPVFAQAKYSIKQMTPEVQNALNNRRDRFDQLRELKSQGIIGENNKGYVEALESSGKSIVSEENRDRRVIYQTIAEQNDLEGAISTIEKVFAAVQRDKASSGDKIQEESGKWLTK